MLPTLSHYSLVTIVALVISSMIWQRAWRAARIATLPGGAPGIAVGALGFTAAVWYAAAVGSTMLGYRDVVASIEASTYPLDCLPNVLQNCYGFQTAALLLFYLGSPVLPAALTGASLLRPDRGPGSKFVGTVLSAVAVALVLLIASVPEVQWLGPPKAQRNGREVGMLVPAAVNEPHHPHRARHERQRGHQGSCGLPRLDHASARPRATRSASSNSCRLSPASTPT